MKKKTVNGSSALKSGFEPDVVVLDEATAMNTNPIEAEQLQKNDITEWEEECEEDDSEILDILSEASEDGEEDTDAAEKDALNDVLRLIRKSEGSSYEEIENYGISGDTDSADNTDSASAAFDYEDSSVITYPGQHHPKRYRSYGAYKCETYKIRTDKREDYAYYTADNALITVDPDLDEGVTPEIIKEMHKIRDNEVHLNNKVTKRIPPNEKKALKAEYDKEQKKLPNSYKEMKEELNAKFTFAHYDAWKDAEGHSLLDHLPNMASSQEKSPENIAINRIHSEELANLLGSKILKLSERTQKVIYMKFFLHMTNIEIGKAINVSESYVREIISRALHQLRRPGA